MKTNIETGNSSTYIGEGSGTFFLPSADGYSNPRIIDTIIRGDEIEVVFRQDSNIVYDSYPPLYRSPKIYSIVYKLTGEKKRYEGNYISPQGETYSINK